MILFLITFLSTILSVYHILSSVKHKNIIYKYNNAQKSITIIIPCYNEAPIIKNTIDGLQNLDYKNFNVIFVNDGSTDETFNILNNELELAKINTNYVKLDNSIKSISKSVKYSHITVIDKYNTGKANSLNKAISLSDSELILTMDGDCVLKSDTLKIMSMTFTDKNVIASGGAIHIMQVFKLQKKPSLLILLQSLDYIKGFYVYKSSLAYNNALAIISGAFGVFKRTVLEEIGCFNSGLGEDIDLTLRIQQYAYQNNKKIIYNDNAICYTECPEKLRDLSAQRIRWQKGFIDSVIKNRKFIFRNLIKSNVCFFIFFDAITINSIAIIALFINLYLISIKLVTNGNLDLLYYILLLLIFNYIYSIIALYKAKKYVSSIKFKNYIFIILIDMLLFRFMYIYFFIYGSISYCLKFRSWNKIKRTNNKYILRKKIQSGGYNG
ncbi:glycosyltransferase family 2 protein [Sedimentibacter sp. zth1]|uniref:glycosyltransferase n=1 Tax=Sedimentibacter sp. zth1 TaxID=2816908 RepID=UPI001A932EFB|nr:glycosyltransferase [Sedimentibacter sp. zth1]QSX05777.1 glycosyltransferase family 2 protein [Sedimentibacter sp. zth1]